MFSLGIYSFSNVSCFICIKLDLDSDDVNKKYKCYVNVNYIKKLIQYSSSISLRVHSTF